MSRSIPVGRILTELADAAPDRPVVTCAGDTVVRAELEEWSNQRAHYYADQGVGPGDFVTIALPNSVEFFAVTFAVWKLGAVPQPVSPKLPRRELTSVIELADPKLVIGVDPEVLGGRTVLRAGDTGHHGAPSDPILPVRTPPAWKAPTSGGSTGRPKLIVSGQPGELDPDEAVAYGMQRDGVQLVPGPLYHNAPLSFAMSGLFVGQHLIVLRTFDPIDALDAIDRHKVDFVNFVPTMMLRILRVLEAQPDRFDIGSLGTVWHMAAPCPAWLKREWIDLVGADRLFEMYGGTEGQSVTVITGREWLERPGSVGKPAYGEMRIFDESGNAVTAGEVGEIFMRRPAGTPPTYRYVGAEAKRRDDWESLGDLGWMDEDGYVYISDRRVDMVLSGGANIYPAEVESALMEHPSVESCVVIGLPDEDLGQKVHALVQASEPGLDADTVRDFLRERLAPYKLPRSFRFVEEPLRDDAGKVRRTAVRDREVELHRSTASNP